MSTEFKWSHVPCESMTSASLMIVAVVLVLWRPLFFPFLSQLGVLCADDLFACVRRPVGYRF